MAMRTHMRPPCLSSPSLWAGNLDAGGTPKQLPRILGFTSTFATTAQNGVDKRHPASPQARMNQNPGQDNEVVAFLEKTGLSSLAEVFTKNGFDDLETLLATEDEDLRAIGFSDQNVANVRNLISDHQAQKDPKSGNGKMAVVAFLGEIGLVQYSDKLLAGGFDDLETLALIEDADMKDFGIPRGHALKLRKRLDERLRKNDAAGALAGIRESDRLRVRTFESNCATPTAWSLASPCSLLGSRRPRQDYSSSLWDRNKSRPVTYFTPSENAKSAAEKSWDEVQTLGIYTFGELLYKNTFKLAPQAIQLFPKQVRRRYLNWNEDSSDEVCNRNGKVESAALKNLFSKVVSAVGCTVAGLNDITNLVPMLTMLGARHVHYKVPEIYWPILGKALDMTLAELLGCSYTSEVQKEWASVFSLISNIMIEGMRSAAKTRFLGTKPNADGDNASVVSEPFSTAETADTDTPSTRITLCRHDSTCGSAFDGF